MSEARTRFPQERHRQMMDVIADAKRIGTSDLAGIMGVSLPTLRRDLITLEQAGLILRIHGGVVAAVRVRALPSPCFWKSCA
ncbi:DeoR/GlpR transcriptional regulator [Ochrobactrum haematophilum]|uniref:DeoR/GlpR transcriptional regulator n=1 Tax=Brucella haematophila TaxID=419474 RepID=A0ABX1DVG8_9HYPH|nr:DeoR/GlpR transcriptional regulator [Brucella haematophila]